MPRPGCFTAETARIAAALAVAARRAAALRPPPPPPPPITPAHTGPDPYLSRRLNRVRTQLDSIDSAIEAAVKEGASIRLRNLCDAQSRLAEQERILAGRPLPGSRRPGSRQDQAPPPLDAEPIWPEQPPASPTPGQVGQPPA